MEISGLASFSKFKITLIIAVLSVKLICSQDKLPKNTNFNYTSFSDDFKFNNNKSKTLFDNERSGNLKFLNEIDIEGTEQTVRADHLRNEKLSIKQSNSYFTKKFKTNFDIYNFSGTCSNTLDFLSFEKMNIFQFNLEENLKFFLKEFKSEKLTDLKNNKNYNDFILRTFKKRTILIGVDGLAQICAELENYKSFAYLMMNGSYQFKTRSTTEGLSGPGWSSLFCSLHSEDTGIIDNKWRAPWVTVQNLRNYKYSTPITGLNKPLPCIFQILKSNLNNFTNIFYSSWDFFFENFSSKAIPNSIDIYSECFISSYPSFYDYSICDDFSLDASKNFVLQGFDFYFWYFSSLDVAGHNYGFCSMDYKMRLKQIDEHLLNFFKFLEDLNVLDKINIILTSDHGTDINNNSHGNDKYDGNLFVPLFMMGPDFKKNFEIQTPISILDIAPTIALLNNIKPSEFWIGKPIISALNKLDETLSINGNPLHGTNQSPFWVNKFNSDFYFLIFIFLIFKILLICREMVIKSSSDFLE